MNPQTILSVGLSIVVLIMNIIIFVTIKFNDLVHLSADVKSIKETVEKTESRIEKLEIGQATQKAICDERSTMYRLNKRIKNNKTK